MSRELIVSPEIVLVEKLEKEYGKVLLSRAIYLCGSRETAMELVQEVWLKVIGLVGKLQLVHDKKAWLFTILRSTCVDRYRAEKVRAAAPIDEALELACFDEPYKVLIHLEDAKLLLAAINSLGFRDRLIGEAWRDTIMHRGVDQYARIAQEVGIPTGQIRNHVHRVIRTLRAKLRAAL